MNHQTYKINNNTTFYNKKGNNIIVFLFKDDKRGK